MSETQSPAPFSPDTHRLLNQLLAVGGAVLLFVLFAYIVLPGVRRESAEPKARPGEQAPTAASAGWLDEAEAPAQGAIQIPPLDPAEVLEPTAPLLERGKTLYAQNCASCHGAGGKGDGIAAAALRPKPRDFTAAAGWKNGATKSGVFQTLQAGLPGTGMVAYDFLTPKDRMALVHTVRSFAPNPPADDPAALAALSASLARPGGAIPARIPVGQAIRALVAESRPVAPLDLAAPGLSPEAAALLARSVVDPGRAARTLAGLPGWRTDAVGLARTVTAGTPHNGFRPGVAALDTESWTALQAALAAAGAPGT